MEIVISNGTEPHNSMMALRTKTILHQRRRNSASRMKHHLPHEFLICQTALHSSGSSALTITSANSSKCNKILHMNIYICMYIYTHTHTLFILFPWRSLMHCHILTLMKLKCSLIFCLCLFSWYKFLSLSLSAQFSSVQFSCSVVSDSATPWTDPTRRLCP